MAVVVAIGVPIGTGVSGAFQTTGGITAAHVRAECSAMPHGRGIVRVQLFGDVGAEETIGSHVGALCVAGAASALGDATVDLRPGGGVVRVVFSGVLQGDVSFLVTAPSVRRIEVTRASAHVTRASHGLWVLYEPGNFSDDVLLQGPRFDIGVVSGVDRRGFVVGFSPIYLCPQQVVVKRNACL